MRKLSKIVLPLVVAAIMLAAVFMLVACNGRDTTTPPNGSTTDSPPIEESTDVEGFIPIRTAADLNLIRTNLNGNFRLGANLTIENHVPIGNLATPFTGHFYVRIGENGQPQYTIETLSINHIAAGTTQITGLFGVNNGMVENVVIENLNISLQSLTIAQTFIGGIAGENTGIITNSHVENAAITVTSDGGGIAIGAIAGINRGENAKVEYSSSAGTINMTLGDGGAHSRAAGLVGILSEGATVFRSSSGVNVTSVTSGSMNVTAAGLVGFVYNHGFIKESFAMGNAHTTGRGTIYAGGLTGNVQTEADAPTGSLEDFRWIIEISDSFATGNATGVSGANAYVSAFIPRLADDEGAYSNIIIRNVFSTGNSRVELHSAVTVPGNNNRVAGGIIGRYQSVRNADDASVLTVENAFVTGNVFGDSVELAISTTNTSVGLLFARAQQENTHQFNNLFYLITATAIGQRAPQSFPRAETTAEGITQIATLPNLQNSTWQAANLGFDASIWTFRNGAFPMLTWAA